MNVICWCLLLINICLGLLIATQGQRVAPQLLNTELHPAQMKLLSEQDLATYPVRALMPETQAMASTESLRNMTPPDNQTAQLLSLACYEWGSFNATATTQALRVAKQLNLKALINQQTAANQNTRYWIYRPPLESQEAAQAQVEQFKRLGVDEVFIVQDPQFKYAISFGVFRDEQLADKLMVALKAKGVSAVVKARRLGGEGQTMLQLNAINTIQYEALKKTQPLFPDTELKEVSCPNVT